MNPNQLKQLEKLAKVFNVNNIVSPEDIQEVLKGILGLLTRFKQENSELNKETKQTVEAAIAYLSEEHAQLLGYVENSTQNVKSEATEAITKALEEVKQLAKEVMEMKPKDGERGLDADEEVIVEKVLGKIVLPEYKETVLDSGEQIVDKINALDLSPDNQIDASHIKNLPEPRMIGGGSTARNLYQLGDVSVSGLANNDVLKYNSTTNLWENGVGGGGSGTVTSVAATVPTGLTISGSPVTTSGTLAIALDTGYVIPLQSTLDGFVPYTGATTNVDLGAHNLTVDTNTFFVDSVNNRVGIGTAGPAYKLDVNGDVRIPDGSAYRIGSYSNITSTGQYNFSINTAYGQALTNSSNQGTGFPQGAWSTIFKLTPGGDNAYYGPNISISTANQSYNSSSPTGLVLNAPTGGPYTGGSATRRAGSDITLNLGHGVAGTGDDDGGDAGNAIILLKTGGAGSGSGVAGSDSSFLVKNSASTAIFSVKNSGNVGIGTTTPDQLLHEEVSDAGTNAVVFGQRHSHITSGTATTGFGIGEEYELENASGTNRVAGTNEFAWTDATNATEDASWKLKLMRAGTLTEALGVDSLGALTANGIAVPTISSTDTLSNKTLTAPKFADLGFIADANGNEMIIFDTVASAVNEITLANAATTGTPTISATGGDTNINLQLTPKGTGIVKGELKRFMVRLLANTTDTATGTTIGGDYRISNRAITVKAVGAYVDTAGTTNTTTIDINEAGTTILSTKITIDSTEKSSETAATAPVISDTAIAADAVVTFDIDAINTTPAKGLTVWVDYIFS